MYSVAKRIEFCYGHRLLDYNGVCAHPHGHNAVAELEIRSDTWRAQHGDGFPTSSARVKTGWTASGSQDDHAAGEPMGAVPQGYGRTGHRGQQHGERSHG